jgi:2-iminobutanoate/2-iminopropanoate deaminase
MKKMNVKVVLVLLLVLASATLAFAEKPKDVYKPEPISTPDAPAAVGPYSQGIKYGDLVFLSGQLPIDPANNNSIQLYCDGNSTYPCISTSCPIDAPDSTKQCKGNITEQTKQVMDNLGAVLAAANLKFKDVLMTTVYLVNIGDFNAFNIAYGEYFGCDCLVLTNGACTSWDCGSKPHPPARATVAVKDIPKGSVGALLEVSIIAGK